MGEYWDFKKEILAKAREVLTASKSLTVYRQLRDNPVWEAFESLFKEITRETPVPETIADRYYHFLHLIANYTGFESGHAVWKGWLLENILRCENVFSIQAEKRGPNGLTDTLKAAVDHDLQCLHTIGCIQWNHVIRLLEWKTGTHGWLNPFESDGNPSWEEVIKEKGLRDWNSSALAEYYSKWGTGIFSIYKGFRWNGKALEGIGRIDPITLEQLIGYDHQKEVLIENTKQFVRGYPANNVLLYGDKGTGKSSMVKALVYRFGNQGLRVVEVPKIYLKDYYKILPLLENRKFKFIIFIDDLSFEETEVEYKHIKALLEGGLEVRPSNVLVYATSNRRHLVRETGADRSGTSFHFNEQEEISPTDSMQEKLSLSDRFGITLTFTSPNQTGYVQMVEAIARERKLDISQEELIKEALMWEKKYNGRSGRTARQFVDYLEGRIDSK